MCGINCLLITKQIDEKKFNEYRQRVLHNSSLIRHRGPDWSGNYCYNGNGESIVMCHERLEIIDPHGGSQPLIYRYKPKDIFSKSTVFIALKS